MDETAPDVEQVAPAEEDVLEITVIGEAPITAASALTTTGIELEMRPITRPGDVAEVMPGMFAVQHAGGGKANQYFVRGFDADHGTDVAIPIEGMPVNMVSHAHGQGYADMHRRRPSGWGTRGRPSSEARPTARASTSRSARIPSSGSTATST